MNINLFEILRWGIILTIIILLWESLKHAWGTCNVISGCKEKWEQDLEKKIRKIKKELQNKKI